MSDEARKQLAHKFIEAGYARYEITEEDLKSVGITRKIPKYANTWYEFCNWVHKQITKQEIGHCRATGRGFRSQWYGRQVAESLGLKKE